jgi:hypothetical protein
VPFVLCVVVATVAVFWLLLLLMTMVVTLLSHPCCSVFILLFHYSRIFVTFWLHFFSHFLCLCFTFVSVFPPLLLPCCHRWCRLPWARCTYTITVVTGGVGSPGPTALGAGLAHGLTRCWAMGIHGVGQWRVHLPGQHTCKTPVTHL